MKAKETMVSRAELFGRLTVIDQELTTLLRGRYSHRAYHRSWDLLQERAKVCDSLKEAGFTPPPAPFRLDKAKVV